MNALDTLRQSVANLITPKVKNSTNGNLTGREFLRTGNKRMIPGWDEVMMSDRDLYTGYSYAAIRNRSNAVARVALDHIRTDASKKITDAAKKSEEPVIHPYLALISSSPTFSDHKFWADISTYLDLEGIYYLMALRNSNDSRTGDIQEFKMLNPYLIRRVLDPSTLEVTGYVETRGSLVREIPREMIIEMRELNPFDENAPYAMTDAAKESQFTLKTTGDYTRHSLKNNVNAPGILTTDVILPQPDFENFKSRIVNHTKGEPIFGNGSGAIKWDAMQIDLDKAGLAVINETNRDALLAVAGVSKTIIGIEQSGTTRDTAQVQRELHMESQTLPRIQLIIDALNQDYKNHYPKEFSANQYMICVDNPLGSDHEAEIQEVDMRQKQLDLYQALLDKGYDAKTAAKYAEGDITIDELGEPVEKPIPEPTVPVVTPVDPTADPLTNSAVHNQLTTDQQGILGQQQGALQNAVVNIQAQLTMAVINKITKNSIDSESDIITKTDRKRAVSDLDLALATFYSIIFPLYGATVMTRRANEFGKFGSFSMTSQAKNYIKGISSKVAEGHIDTIVNELYQIAHQAAIEGKSQQQIVQAIRQQFSDSISTTRAKAVARTETNRAFTQSQFTADTQFIAQNGLEGRAYKKWITRSDAPCPICSSLAAEPPIPFDNNFRNLGDEMTVTYEENDKTKVRKMVFDFQALSAGNAHTNCSCIYQLIIE